MKRTIARVLAADPIARLWSPLLQGRATVFTLHRFAQPEDGIAGHDSSLLRATLARLRRERYDLLSLEDAIGRARDPNASGRAIAFTVDDGYQDVAKVAAEIFLEYDCPLSIFLTTGFIDGRLWHWWDQIEFICLTTDRPSLDVVLGDTRVTVVLDDRVDRRALIADLRERCKQVSEQSKLGFIARLAESAGVEIPSRPPAQYRGLSWDDVRGLERRGFRFGPHGVSHAALARTSDGDAAQEIRESWERLKAETAYPMPVFAYPNGMPGDYGLREMEAVQECRMVAAVTAVPGYVSRQSFLPDSLHRFALPRFPYPDEPDGVCVIASGLWLAASIVWGTQGTQT